MDLPRDIPLDSVVVLRYEKRSKSENKVRVPTEMELVLEQTQQEHQSDTKVIHNDDGNPSRANIKQALGRFHTIVGNPVNEILLKLNLPDHKSILTDSKEYIKMDVESFYEYISWLLGCKNELRTNLIASDFVSDKMTIYFYMLCPSMMNRIRRQGHSRAFVDDLNTTDCFLEVYDIRQGPKKTTYPDIDLLVIGQATQSLYGCYFVLGEVLGGGMGGGVGVKMLVELYNEDDVVQGVFG
ncbi:hypothetical protein Tco_0958770 [Tanacetum coccineum]